MDRNSKILFSALVVFVILSVSATFYKTVILQDFIVYTEVDCDPTIESCFMWTCDPETDEEEACTGNLEEDTWYFKIAYRNAKNVEHCDLNNESCLPFQCSKEEPECREVLCSEESLFEYDLGESCTQTSDFFTDTYSDDSFIVDIE